MNILAEFEVPLLIKMCLNGTYSKVCIGKHLSDSFPIQNGLKPGETETEWAHQFLAYSDDMNLVGDNIYTINKKQTLIDASKEVGVEVNREH
jgi:hypothetical protein